MSPIAWSRLARRNDTRRSDIRSRDGLLRYRLLLLSTTTAGLTFPSASSSSSDSFG